MEAPIVRDVRPSDKDEWSALYSGYASFYEVEQTAAMRDRVWSWLHDEQKEPRGLVAEGSDGRLVGLAHMWNGPVSKALAA